MHFSWGSSGKLWCQALLLPTEDIGGVEKALASLHDCYGSGAALLQNMEREGWGGG